MLKLLNTFVSFLSLNTFVCFYLFNIIEDKDVIP